MKKIFKIKDMMYNKDIQYAVTSASLKETLKKMIDSKFSQMPVKSKDGEIKGVISMESIVKQLFALNSREFAGQTVDFMDEKLNYAPALSNIFDSLDELKNNNFVLIKNGTQVEGIVTTYDLLVFFLEFAGAFLILHEVEELLRYLLKSCLQTNEAFIQARNNALKGPEFQKLDSINKLHFDNYKVILLNKSNRYYFKECISEADHEPLNRHMEAAREVRNNICHFKTEPCEADKVVLLKLRNFLKSKILYSSEASQ